MQAIVIHDYGSYSIEAVPRPEPTGREVLVAVDRAQLSVTECRLYQGEEMIHQDAVSAQLRDGSARLFGHEFCGTVAAVGPDVSGFTPGDRVYPPGKIPCETCSYCQRGYQQYCPDKTQLGYDLPAGLAEYALVPEAALVGLPDAVSDAEGAAMQPLASAVLCVEDAGIHTGDVVAIVGAGVMGSHCGQLALTMGASTVYASDLVARKRDLAADHGMTPIDPTETGPAVVVNEATDGIGADVVIEAVGEEQSHATEGDDPLAQAYQMVRRGGTILQVGHITGEITLQPKAFRAKNLRWINPSVGVVQMGPNAHTGAIAADLVAAGRLQIDPYISHELAGLSAFEDAIDITLDPERKLGPAQIIISE